MKFTTRARAKRETGLTYLGTVGVSHKHSLAANYNEMTYSIHLSPANFSGYEVCPMRTKECTTLCLNESGLNRMSMNGERINNTRINKTRLFFEHREFFVDWMIAEIEAASMKAMKKGFRFSVRLNNTSDISPESFHTIRDGKRINILEVFPDIMFYDYTKVPKRHRLTSKYDNYDVTFSYSGENLDECHQMLEKGVRVAVVFKKNLPQNFWGKEVIDGDLYDMRYRDPKDVIIGLKYKTVRGKVSENSKFVIH